MKDFDIADLQKLYIPAAESHKGQNGKVMVIGGSELFHAASLWALEIASKIVDMTFYCSVPTNEQIVIEQKKRFGNGIVVTGEHIEDYAQEADAILIGPGLVRTDEQIRNSKSEIRNIEDILQLSDEGLQTYYMTQYLLEKFPDKRWVIDAGALQMMDPQWLLGLTTTPILTPHQKEFERLFETVILEGAERPIESQEKDPIASLQDDTEYLVGKISKKYHCVTLLKGPEDIVCAPLGSAQGEIFCTKISGGNAGMTKGGTGDVLSGLTAALYAQNDNAFLVAQAASYINKKAGDALFEKVGYYFNATDLVQEIPSIMKQILL